MPEHLRQSERFYPVRASSEQGAKNAALAEAKTEGFYTVSVTRVRQLEEPEAAPIRGHHQSARRR